MSEPVDLSEFVKGFRNRHGEQGCFYYVEKFRPELTELLELRAENERLRNYIAANAEENIKLRAENATRRALTLGMIEEITMTAVDNKCAPIIAKALLADDLATAVALAAERCGVCSDEDSYECPACRHDFDLLCRFATLNTTPEQEGT